MKYGIVGASGTLGQVAARQLLARSEASQINALIRRSDDGLEALERCRTFVGGIFDEAQLDRFVAESDLIVNLAARNPVDEDLDRQNYRDFFLVNGIGAAAVAAAAERHRKPLLHFSSVSVYETGIVKENHPFTEDTVLPAGDPEIGAWYSDLIGTLRPLLRRAGPATNDAAPADVMAGFFDERPLPVGTPVYGLSKLLGETLTLDIATSATAIRMSDVYGPGHESRGVVIDHLQALAAGQVTVDFGSRESVYFVYIDDVCDLIANVADRSGDFASLPDIVNFVGERVGESDFAGVLGEISSNADINLRDARETAEGVDRRYGRTGFDRTFPNFRITALAEGLRKTSAE